MEKNDILEKTNQEVRIMNIAKETGFKPLEDGLFFNEDTPLEEIATCISSIISPKLENGNSEFSKICKEIIELEQSFNSDAEVHFGESQILYEGTFGKKCFSYDDGLICLVDVDERVSYKWIDQSLSDYTLHFGRDNKTDEPFAKIVIKNNKTIDLSACYLTVSKNNEFFETSFVIVFNKQLCTLNVGIAPNFPGSDYIEALIMCAGIKAKNNEKGEQK